MALAVPNLDTRDFDQLYDEARSLIPRHAPQWTDHNTHDPGIMLIELVAWLIDQDLYQLGFVSDNHIRSFAALLGVRALPAKPATGLIWPYDSIVASDAKQPGAFLPAGTSVQAKEQPEVPFEIAEDVFVSPAQLCGLSGLKSSHRADIKGQTARWPSPATLSPDQTLVLEFDRPLVGHECGAEHRCITLGFDIEDPLDIPKNADVSGHFVVKYLVKRKGQKACDVDVCFDETAVLSRTGLLVINIPAVYVCEQYCSELHIQLVEKSHTLKTRLHRISLNTLPVVQQNTQPALSFDKPSTGMVNQTFELKTDFLVSELIIETQEACGREQWLLVESLCDSGPYDRQFEFDNDTHEIQFGNGINGAIPKQGTILNYCAFKVSAGEQGNLSQALSWRIPGVNLTNGLFFGANIRAITGGKDPSDLNDLLTRTRQRALSRRVALTNHTLIDRVMDLRWLGIERVGIHITEKKPTAAKIRNLVVVPVRDRETDPSEVLATDDIVPATTVVMLKKLIKLMEYHRVLGEDLNSISIANIAKVSVVATITIRDDRPEQAIRESIRHVLLARLSDIRIPESRVEPWPIGRAVKSSEIKSLLANIDEVVAVEGCKIKRSTNKLNADDAISDTEIALRSNEIAIIDEIRLTFQQDQNSVSYDQEYTP